MNSRTPGELRKKSYAAFGTAALFGVYVGYEWFTKAHVQGFPFVMLLLSAGSGINYYFLARAARR